jgi:hypothetical protein
MPATVVLDELHLTFRIPISLSDGEVWAIRRVLTGKAFTAAVIRAVLAEMKKYPVMTPVRVTVTR